MQPMNLEFESTQDFEADSTALRGTEQITLLQAINEIPQPGLDATHPFKDKLHSFQIVIILTC